MSLVIKKLNHPKKLTYKNYKKEKRMRLFCVRFPRERERERERWEKWKIGDGRLTLVY